MSQILVPSKIRWRVDLSKSWEENYHPSICKKISRGLSSFEERYIFSKSELTQNNFEQIFLPIYREVILAKTNYTLDFEKTIAVVQNAINKPNNPFRLLAVKDQNETIGGVVYSEERRSAYIKYRAFYRGHKYKDLSADFWADFYLFQDFQQAGYSYYSYGRDTHPYIDNDLGKRTGLALYKLQVGAKPGILDEDEEAKFIDYDNFSNNTTVVYFSDLSENEYQTINIQSRLKLQDSEHLSQLTKVSEWAGLNINFS